MERICCGPFLEESAETSSPEMVTAHLNLTENAIKEIPAEKMGVIAG
jgi:hypothetical protein